jgi:hypothetical protein
MWNYFFDELQKIANSPEVERNALHQIADFAGKNKKAIGYLGGGALAYHLGSGAYNDWRTGAKMRSMQEGG